MAPVAKATNRMKGHVKGRALRFISGHNMVARPWEDRFWEKAQKGDGCWEWTACRHPAGYGRFMLNGTRTYAHRLAYEVSHGPIPAGMHVCHHCDNPPCVNPAHLFLGTAKDNADDKARKGRNVNPLTDANKRKTHCPKGHAYDEANTLIRRYAGHSKSARACRACLREWDRKRPTRRMKIRAA